MSATRATARLAHHEAGVVLASAMRRGRDRPDQDSPGVQKPEEERDGRGGHNHGGEQKKSKKQSIEEKKKVVERKLCTDRLGTSLWDA